MKRMTATYSHEMGTEILFSKRSKKTTIKHIVDDKSMGLYAESNLTDEAIVIGKGRKRIYLSLPEAMRLEFLFKRQIDRVLGNYPKKTSQASEAIGDSTHEAEKVENVKKCEKACEAKAEEEREIAADKIKMLADEIYQQCVEKKMSCHDFGLLAALINQHKASAFSTVRCQMDELPLPSRN